MCNNGVLSGTRNICSCTVHTSSKTTDNAVDKVGDHPFSFTSGDFDMKSYDRNTTTMLIRIEAHIRLRYYC